jgi:transcriptional repressor NF-X1
MPIADSNSSSTTGLNVNAMEFVPTLLKVENNQNPETSNGASRSTGAVPKSHRRPNRYYEDNRRNWRSSAGANWRREDQRNNGEIQKEKLESSENQKENLDDGNRGNAEKKYFKNNSNDRNRFKRPNSYNKNNPQKHPQRSSKKSSEAQITQRERLVKEIETNNLECMICCEKIKAFQPTFNCKNCFAIQHLGCIKTWVKNSKSDQGEWRCPACNQVSKHKPSEYLCFCGKLKNPPVNRNDLAHSCGDMCLSTSNCPHPCQLRCHPGKICLRFNLYRFKIIYIFRTS